MLRKGLALLTVAFLTAPLFADIQLQTSINDVFNRGTNELAGSITMNVDDDDFSNTSTSQPVYIRVTLDHLATLSNTLVDLTIADGSSNDMYNEPIYLAMTLNTVSGVQQLNADSATVSIVRWVKGESSIWIRVQSTSSDWIDESGILFAPDENVTVSWTFGISARLSFRGMLNIPAARRNLPYNTRDLVNAADGDADFAVSTLLCVDLSGSDLTTTGVESVLNFDPIAFDDTSDPTDLNDHVGNNSYGVFRPGNDTGINFSDDRPIARGKTRECTVDIADKGAFVVQPICVSRTGGNSGSISGWLTMTNTIVFEVDCRRGGEFLDTDLFDGAYVTLSTGGRGNYGFEDTNDVSFTNAGVSGQGSFVPGTGFSSGGDTLYRSIILAWNGGFEILDDFDMGVQATVYYFYTNGPTDVTLDWSITLVNHEGEEDFSAVDPTHPNGYDPEPGVTDGDFVGDDQHRRCPPSEFLIGEGTWDMGSFVECVGTPVSIFFPYLPRLVGADALFWSGLSLVNHGFTDLDVTVHLYDEEGNLFVADFPELPVRNQYTWLLIDDPEAGGTGFYGTGANEGSVIIPEASSGVDPASFGTSRMSMFAVGSYNAEFLDELNSADLDGYLLIGKDGDIDGSYLPRNFDGSGQIQDLPLRSSKRVVGETAQTRTITEDTPAKFKFQNGRWVNKGDFQN